MTRVDPQKVAAVIAEIARSQIMSRFGRLGPEDVRRKSGPADLVTAVDEATENELQKALGAIRPDAAFIGEESLTRNPASMRALDDDGAAWIVDPLDGTRNFVRGVPEFAVIVALVEGRRTKMGWIFAAPDDACAVAVAGAGAIWNRERIAPIGPVSGRPRGLRSIGWLEAGRQERVGAALARHFDSAPGHCSAYAYLRLARGEIDFKISSRIHPWDHAAGALLLAETGGRAAWLDDARPYEPCASCDEPLLAVAPGRDWRGIAERLLEGEE
jgi:fructose-1,6-bisphosphatase/inositol monophosphatase family enzyme